VKVLNAVFGFEVGTATIVELEPALPAVPPFGTKGQKMGDGWDKMRAVT